MSIDITEFQRKVHEHYESTQRSVIDQCNRHLLAIRIFEAILDYEFDNPSFEAWGPDELIDWIDAHKENPREVARLFCNVVYISDMSRRQQKARQRSTERELERATQRQQEGALDFFDDELIEKIVDEAKLAATHANFVDAVMEFYPQVAESDMLLEAIVDEGALYAQAKEGEDA
jgi:hypothetical protein